VGGHPRAEDNLWLQRWDGAWNARVKDRLERRLQVMVCAGEIDLYTRTNRNSARLARCVSQVRVRRFLSRS
jgi:hypothetical protein